MIELIVLDVDGSMTDGSIIYDKNFVESKVFNVKDGLGIVAWQKLGKKVAIISGRNSEITQFRASELGITEVYMGVSDKANVLKKLCEKLNLKLSQVACIGDDLNDLGMFEICGLSFSPKDGNAWVKEVVDVVLSSKGGRGAVREMIEYISIEYGFKDEILQLFK